MIVEDAQLCSTHFISGKIKYCLLLVDIRIIDMSHTNDETGKLRGTM